MEQKYNDNEVKEVARMQQTDDRFLRRISSFVLYDGKKR